MTVWACRGCAARYRLRLSRCPRCHGVEFEEQPLMPKISVHMGATNSADIPAPAEVPAVEPAATTTPAVVEPASEESAPSAGTSSSPSNKPRRKNGAPKNQSPEPPAPTTGNPSEPDPTGGSTASSTDGGPATPEDSTNTPDPVRF